MPFDFLIKNRRSAKLNSDQTEWEAKWSANMPKLMLPGSVIR